MADITISISDQQVVGGGSEVEVRASGDTTILGTASDAQMLAENMMRYAEGHLFDRESKNEKS